MNGPSNGSHPGREPDPAPPARLVEWESTGRRLRRSSLLLVGAGPAMWVITSIADGTWSRGSLGNWFGLSLLAMFIVEVVVVGGSAVRGLLNAGDRGERLSSRDVGLFPPRHRAMDADRDT